jgi:SNF2 family DNA or RNA helicase
MDRKLSDVLDLAQRYNLCTGSQREMMSNYVQSGRFSPEYYIDMWGRRLTDHSSQSAASVQKVLSTNAQLHANSTPAPLRQDIQSTPPSNQQAGAAPVFHRAHGMRKTAAAVTCALKLATKDRSQDDELTERIRQADKDPSASTVSTFTEEMVKPIPKGLMTPPKESMRTLTQAVETIKQESGRPSIEAAATVKQESMRPYELSTLTVKQESMRPCTPVAGTITVEHDQEWHDAPKELMRRATRNFQAEEDSEKNQEVDPTGEWRGIGGGLVELTTFKTGSPGGFRLQRTLFSSLRPYQRAGVSWMAEIYQAEKGAILADEMGLGKTVQACALLSGIKKAGASYVLIIVPVTLLDQWDREASKWCPEWRVYIYHGTAAQRARALQGVMSSSGGILLTSYSVLKNADDRLFQVTIFEEDASALMAHSKRQRISSHDEKAWLSKPLRTEGGGQQASESVEKKSWDLVICDEAHVMRNISTLLGKHLRSVCSKSRILLTGTPVQNSLQDLWALMDFAQPGLLGNHSTFVKNLSDPIDKGSVRGASPFAVQLKKHLCEQLWTLVKPHMLRRTKASVGLLAETVANVPTPIGQLVSKDGEAPLPPKFEAVVWLMPTSEQVKAYKKVLEKSEVIQEASATAKLGFAVFRAIGLLKRLCNHPALGLPVTQNNAWKDFLSETFGRGKGKRKACHIETTSVPKVEGATGIALTDPEQVEADDDASAGKAVETMLSKLPRDVESLISQSAKLRCLTKMLPAFASQGHRTLVFSQGLKMMDLVELCVLKKLGIKYLRIDGSTDIQSRTDRVQQFQTEPDSCQCLLLTTGVGGVGLNLTSANRVILLDPAWNPAVDAQAVDRVYRLGQKREVKVYRLVMNGLIEDKMFRLQVFKMGLTKTALDAKQQQRYFTSSEIRGLFDWTDPKQGETRKLLLEKHGVEEEDFAKLQAQHDLADDWLEAGPALGLSNFSILYSSLAQDDDDDVVDEECTAQVAEMKTKLGQVDEAMRKSAANRQAVEEQLREAQSGMQDSAKKIAAAYSARANATAASKKCNVELTKARRSETSAMQRLERAIRERFVAREASVNAEQLQVQAEQAAAVAENSSNDATQAHKDVEAVVNRALEAVRTTLATVQTDGQALPGGPVEIAVRKCKAVHRSLEQVEKSLEGINSGWAVALDAERALLEIYSEPDSRPKDRSKSESAQEKAALRLDAHRDAVTNAVASLVESGSAFAEGLCSARDQHTTASSLKTMQQAAKANFRQLSSAWTRSKQAQETHIKLFALRRRAAQKLGQAKSACAEAKVRLEDAESEHQEALQAEEHERDQLAKFEKAAVDAEVQRSAAEAEEQAQKCRRSECKMAATSAKASLRPAKVAEKEASTGRTSLLSHYSKKEKSPIKEGQDASAKSVMEALSAVRALKAEEYDVNQVEEAYQAKKKQKIDPNAEEADV